jgi:hypothetical protein
MHLAHTGQESMWLGPAGLHPSADHPYYCAREVQHNGHSSILSSTQQTLATGGSCCAVKLQQGLQVLQAHPTLLQQSLRTSIGSKLDSVRSSNVFPTPEGPRTNSISPLQMSKVIPRHSSCCLSTDRHRFLTDSSTSPCRCWLEAIGKGTKKYLNPLLLLDSAGWTAGISQRRTMPGVLT